MEFPRRRFLHLAAGTAALPVVPPAPALGQGTIIPTNATMIVERTDTSPSPVWTPTCSIYDARLAPSAGLGTREFLCELGAIVGLNRCRIDCTRQRSQGSM